MPPFPEWLIPMAATLTQERFTGPDWVFERKFDGIRLLAYKQADDVRLFSRNRLAQHLPAVADAIARLPAEDLILDGELTWSGGGYHVFDILWIDGRSVTELPLEERRALLSALPLRPPLALVERNNDAEPWTLACREGWEGVVPVLPVADTIKRVESDQVLETLVRDGLVAAQTPQAFAADVLRAALAGAIESASDCASLVEARGGRVKAVEGDPRLKKVTTAQDLLAVESMLAQEQPA